MEFKLVSMIKLHLAAENKIRNWKMNFKNFFKTLFSEEDGICFGTRFANRLRPMSDKAEHEFFCINPLSKTFDHGHMLDPSYDAKMPRRADLNVSGYRSFLFEMDSTPLEDQLKILLNCSLPITSIVYSGGKSYHAILNVEESLDLEPHKVDSIDEYKHMWTRLAARLSWDATNMGFEYPAGKSSFVDSSCKNPSRLSRFPNAVRDNGNLQKLILLKKSVTKQDFYDTLKKCPEVLKAEKIQYDKPVDVVEDEEVFWALCPTILKDNIKFAKWAGSEGMYPNMLRITLWAIDAVNVDEDLLLEIYDKYTFPKLIKYGYPVKKLTVAVKHAFKMKRSA